MKLTQVISLVSVFVELFASTSAHAQTSALTVEILDKGSHSITQIVDGNRVQLRAVLTGNVSAETQVDFLLDGKAIGICVVAANENTCTTDFIETLGWYWAEGGVSVPARKIQAKAENEAGEAIVDIAPRPVVLAHGLISTAEKFSDYLVYLEAIGVKGYAVGDGQFKGVLNMGNLNNPAESTLTIAENAAQLDTYIEGVKSATGAEQVDLIAHSMGGLVTRYYIHQLMTEDDVAQLIMLGTPNGGSPCGGILASPGFFMPSTLELQTNYINNIFNPQITNTRGVPFHAIGGALITDPSLSPCSGVPSDSTVSQASLEAIPLQLAGLPPLEHNFLATDEAAFREFIQPLLQSPMNGFATSPASQPAFAPEPEQFTQTYSGHLDKDGSTSVTIEIDGNVSVASFGLYDSTQSLQVAVQGASGNTLELDLDNKGILIDDPQTMLYLGYGFENPKPGAWVVTLSTSGETPSTGADYALYARFIGGAALNAQVNEFLPQVGQAVTLSASLDGGQIETAYGNILLPDGKRKHVDLTQAGSQFTAEFTPTQTGLHGIELITTGITPDGFHIDRAVSLAIEAQPAPLSQTRTWVIILAGVAFLLVFPVFTIVKRKRK
ncbi:MAG: alpha/beta hydrolase [Chloroflexi bacterium]|nr:alpha/beta hydrolase [Chloroflexota bacterium]